MTHTFTLAHNTFREAIRDRVLTAALIFGGVLVAASVGLAPLTLGEQERVVRDLGLAAISFFTLLLIILVGTGMVYREIERRTIHTILTQPVSRPAFILGKFLGLYATVLVSLGALSVVYVPVVAVFGGGVTSGVFLALALAGLEALVITAVAIFFSTVSSPMLSAVFTFFVVGAGNLAYDVKRLAEIAENPVLTPITRVMYVLLPSLHHFGTRNSLLAGQPVPVEQILFCLQYSLLYSAAVLLLTIAAFNRRDFE